MEYNPTTFSLCLTIWIDSNSTKVIDQSLFLCLIESIEETLSSFYRAYQDHVKRTIVCGHCLNLGYQTPMEISYEECVQLVTSSETEAKIVKCGPAEIPLEDLAPDICFANLPILKVSCSFFFLIFFFCPRHFWHFIWLFQIGTTSGFNQRRKTWWRRFRSCLQR